MIVGIRERARPRVLDNNTNRLVNPETQAGSSTYYLSQSVITTNPRVQDFVS